MAFGYQKWRAQRSDELDRASQVASTERGPVEFARVGNGPTLVLVHGGPGGYDQMLPMMGDLAEDFTLVSVSRPGYLRTPLSVGPTFAEQADAIAALLDELGIENAAVFGASAGGPASVELAARHPDRISALLLECAVTKTYAPHVPALVKMLFLSEYGAWLQQRFFDRFPRLVTEQVLAASSTLSKNARRSLANEIVNDNQSMRVMRSLLSSMTPYDRRKAGLENDLVQLAALDRVPAEAVRCPTLIAHGMADGDVSHDHAEYAAATIEGAELVSLERGWHLLSLSEGYDTVALRQREFLAKHAHGN